MTAPASQPTTANGIPRLTGLKPCHLAVSTEALLGAAGASDTMTRRWRVLAVEDHHELTSGELVTDMADPLAVVRDKAVLAARKLGFEPQQVILERTAPPRA